MKKLEEILGYSFKNKKLLKQALTHSSCTRDLSKNYERLEFLGDRVLGVAMAHLLYNLFPTDAEGDLSPRFTRLVRKETVAKVALTLNLNDYIQAENKSLCTNENVLCDVAEAVIGAICIEAGLEIAINFVDQHWKHLINQDSEPPKDNKTSLQEISHQLKAGNPDYQVLHKEGSEHEPLFVVKVEVKGHGSAIGKGKNIKIAQQHASANLIAHISQKNEG